MQKKIRFVILGVGHIGKRYIKIIKNNNETELVALIDIKSKDLLRINNNDLPFFNSLEEFLENRLPADVVIIATPNGLHATHAVKCLKNKFDVVIEKPVALKSADVLRIINCAKEQNKKVFAVMQNRYSPPAIWVKDIIDKDILGEIFMVQLNCYWNRDERYYTNDSWHGNKELDGGTLFTQFSHFIDMLFWLFGNIKNINGRIINYNHSQLTDFEDNGIVAFEIEKGGLGSLNFSTSVWDKNMESSMTIIGEKGSIKIGGQYMEKVEYCHIKDYNFVDLEESNKSYDYGAYKGSADNHQYIIDNVINVLQHNSQITTTASEALKVVDIIEKIYASAIQLP